MALSSGTIWEVRTTGSNTLCSGGFNPANPNFATDGAATSGNTSAPVFTSASYNFAAGDVGAWVFIQSGTNWVPGWYQIASVAANAATLTATIGSGQLYGGAIGTSNQAASFIPSTVAGCATTASPTGAVWSVDYSQQNAARHPFTDLVIDAAVNTNFTSAARPVGKNFVGNLIRITAGAGFTQSTVEVISTSGTVATADRSMGTLNSSGGTGYLGGAYAGPQPVVGVFALNVVPSGFRLFIKSGTYTMSSNAINVSGGRVSLSTNNGVTIEGYNLTRGDMGTAPVFTCSSTGIACFTTQATGIIRNITVDGENRTTNTGFTTTNGWSFYKCVARNFTTAGFSGLGNTYFCSSSNCTTGFALGGRHVFAAADGGTNGFSSLSGQGSYANCVSKSQTASGFVLNSSGSNVVNCTSYLNLTGILVSGGGGHFVTNCLTHTNTTGYSNTSGGQLFGYNNASYNDTTAFNYAGNISALYSSIICSAEPCVNVGAENFALNNLTGGGAALKQLAQAFPAIIASITYPDIGAVQNPKPTISGGG